METQIIKMLPLGAGSANLIEMKHYAKLIPTFIIVLNVTTFISCNWNSKNDVSSSDSNTTEGKFGKYAKQIFLEERAFMTEKDALSKEIDWYRDPQITDFSYLGEMSGKDIISICNRIDAENEQNLAALRQGDISMALTYKTWDIKEYAIEHPNEIIASKYHLAGIFTTYDPLVELKS